MSGLSAFLPGGFGGGALVPTGQVAPPAPPPDADIMAATIERRDDGGADLVLPSDPEPADVRTLPHDANLAEVLPEHVLTRLAQLVVEGFDADVESNRNTYEIYGRGLQLLALKPGERKDDFFEGGSGAVHTLLKESVVRFAAEASGELIPAAGPARCQVVGDSTPDKQSLATRKKDWLNFYLTEGDPGYGDDFDKMLPQVALYGSMFRKVRRDPLRRGQPTSRFLSPYDLVTSATTDALNGGDRATHVEPQSASEVIRLQLKGWYLNVDIGMPSDGSMDWKRTAPGDVRTPSDRPEDVEHVLLHQYVLLDLEGFEHLDEEEAPTGLPLPYIVTIDRESQCVLRVVRDWAEGDGEFTREPSFVHYAYMPGLGFLGWGLIHLVGATTDELSVMRQQASNAFTLASFPGGFRVKGASKSENSDINIGPCEFAEIDTGGLPIQNAIMPLTYRDVPPSYVPILEDLAGSGQRLASIGDAAVGDGREDSLPGTVIALINQATKLQSSVIKRLHRAQRIELRMLADLFGVDAEATYPYVVNGRSGKALAADFADNADVLPVSDPNVPTETHRVQLAQGVYQMAQSNPMLDKREATMDFLRALGKSDADITRLIPAAPAGTPADPVSEFVLALKGMPLAVSPAQDHVSHIQAHMAQMSAPGVSQLPASQALVSHMTDHLAAFYAVQVAKLTGLQVQPGQPLPQQQENQVAMAVAAASDKLRAELAQIAPSGGGDGGQAAELAVKKLEIQMKDQDSIRKAESSARSEEGEFLRQQMTLQNDKQTRAVELLTGLMDLEAARLKATGDTAKAGLETLGQQATATSAAIVARHDAGAGHSRAAADMHTATMGAHAAGAQSQADVITAMAEQATAEAERNVAASRANQKGTGE